VIDITTNLCKRMTAPPALATLWVKHHSCLTQPVIMVCTLIRRSYAGFLADLWRDVMVTSVLPSCSNRMTLQTDCSFLHVVVVVVVVFVIGLLR